jgi:hypothetical protein
MIDRTREKVKSKADIKAENIQNAVDAYQAPGSELLMRQAATLFHCSKSSALKDHIDDCYRSGMPISPGLQAC